MLQTDEEGVKFSGEEERVLQTKYGGKTLARVFGGLVEVKTKENLGDPAFTYLN